jgi:NADP-dependent 3-hydroxy acid dehydrogenase YdfG
MAPLAGKVVLVTGASSGFGAAAAKLFARNGCSLVLAARRLDRLEEIAKKIREGGGHALTVAMDVGRPEQIEAMVSSAIGVYGHIDILLNNAGYGRLDWLEDLDLVRDIQTQITVDLLGLIWTTRLVLPHMYQQRKGHIINMCSIAGWAAPPLYSIYSAAKFGVRGFSEGLRRESEPFGVRVSVVYPGSAETEFGAHIGENPTKKKFKTPNWMKLSADDVARSIVGVAKHPRNHLVLPWWMVFAKFLNSHFNGASDIVQADLFRRYHKIQ